MLEKAWLEYEDLRRTTRGPASYWQNVLIPALLEELIEREPDYDWRFGGPAGISALIWITGESKVEYISFVLDVNLEQRTFSLVDIESDNGEYKRGTIGHLNNMQCDRVEFESIDELVSHRLLYKGEVN